MIEQSKEEHFNRGILMNIGFVEALKMENFNCFIFHDVDLLTEDDRYNFTCVTIVFSCLDLPSSGISPFFRTD